MIATSMLCAIILMVHTFANVSRVTSATERRRVLELVTITAFTATVWNRRIICVIAIWVGRGQIAQ